MSPLKFNTEASNIILETKIKSDYLETANLILDTGASLVVLPWKLVYKIGIKIDPLKTIKTTTATTVETVPVVTIPEMSVLGKTVKNVKAIVKDLPSEVPADGLLGLSLLRHFRLTIDFKKGILELT